jgi:hypothetical protein
MALRKAFVLILVSSGLLGFAQPAEAQLNPVGDVKGTVKQGKKQGTFEGTFTIQRFRVIDDALVAVGTLKGVATFDDGTTRDVTKRGVAIPVDLDASHASSSVPGGGCGCRGIGPVVQLNELQDDAYTQPILLRAQPPLPVTCDVLNLVLGPLDLNVLGLEISLNQVVLDIVANPAGGLLGSLLAILCGLNLSTLTDLLGLLLGSLDVLAFVLNLLLLLG